MVSDLKWRTITARVLIAVGVAMIGYFYGTGIYTYKIQRDLRSGWEKALTEQRSELGSQDSSRSASQRILGDDVFGRLLVPKLGIDIIVLEGTDQSTLMRGPGHIKSTAYPEQGLNTAISGHRTTFGAPFSRLNMLEKGDVIKLVTVRGKYEYRMTGRAVVRPTDVSVIGQGFKDRLTLTTCDPPGSAVKRLAVWAEAVADTKADPR